MEKDYYEDKFGGLYADEDMITPAGRIAFVFLSKPNVYKGDEDAKPRYGVSVLFSKELDDNNKAIIEKIKAGLKPLQEAWIVKEHKKTPKVPFDKFREAKLSAMVHPFMKDGDMKSYEGFEGNYYIQANNPERDGRGGILFLDDRKPHEFQPGMICRLQVRARVATSGISWKLKAIKLVKDDGFRFQVVSGPKDMLSGVDEAVEAASATASEAATFNDELPKGSLVADFDKAVAGSGNPAPTVNDLAVL